MKTKLILILAVAILLWGGCTKKPTPPGKPEPVSVQQQAVSSDPVVAQNIHLPDKMTTGRAWQIKEMKAGRSTTSEGPWYQIVIGEDGNIKNIQSIPNDPPVWPIRLDPVPTGFDPNFD